MKVTNSIEIGAAIRARRKKLGFTQVYLSECSGLSVSFISDVEKGKQTAELEKVLTLSKLLGMDLFLEVRE